LVQVSIGLPWSWRIKFWLKLISCRGGFLEQGQRVYSRQESKEARKELELLGSNGRVHQMMQLGPGKVWMGAGVIELHRTINHWVWLQKGMSNNEQGNVIVKFTKGLFAPHKNGSHRNFLIESTIGNTEPIYAPVGF